MRFGKGHGVIGATTIRDDNLNPIVPCDAAQGPVNVRGFIERGYDDGHGRFRALQLG
jgi:hypothetical protein